MYRRAKTKSHCRWTESGSEFIRLFYFGPAANERTKRFGITAPARSGTLAGTHFWRGKDRLVLVGVSHWAIFRNRGIDSADCEDGFSHPDGAGFVDHVQRINRRVTDCMRISDRASSSERSARNGRRSLHQRPPWRRLAQGRTLLDPRPFQPTPSNVSECVIMC